MHSVNITWFFLILYLNSRQTGLRSTATPFDISCTPLSAWWQGQSVSLVVWRVSYYSSCSSFPSGTVISIWMWSQTFPGSDVWRTLNIIIKTSFIVHVCDSLKNKYDSICRMDWWIIFALKEIYYLVWHHRKRNIGLLL